MKGWLVSENYDKIEVGTVESFQGKEKRVILVSTVRANCKLLDYDAKYSLGFLVDDKVTMGSFVRRVALFKETKSLY